MTEIFTKGDVKRKFLSIESESWSDISDLQKELDQLESEDCLVLDVKTLKSHEINDNLYLTQYMIEYLEPLYEVIGEYRAVYDYYNKSIGVYETLEEAKAAERKSGTKTRIVKHSPRVIEFE